MDTTYTLEDLRRTVAAQPHPREVGDVVRTWATAHRLDPESVIRFIIDAPDSTRAIAAGLQAMGCRVSYSTIRQIRLTYE